jgi:5-methylcytosine-specific restriction endonuclease McrA
VCTNRASLREKPEQRREANRRRRALVLAANSPGVAEKDWQRMLRRHQGKCAYCGSSERITMDHIVPIARGGWHAIGNVTPACFPCNASKRDDFLFAWLAGRGTARLKQAT